MPPKKRMTNSEEVHLRSREKSSGSSGFGASSNGESSSKLNTKDKMKRVPGGGRPRNRKVVIGGLLVLALLAWMFLFNGSSTPMHSVGWLDENVYLRFGLNKEVYAVVLDAGSTGTRVLAFAFHQSVHDNNLKLKDELFHEVKPGLSSYSDDPQAGADSVKQLLSRAKIFIPQEHWAKTPVSLKATAGLRLLPKAKADAILEAVSNVIKSIGFHATEDSVGIMDGVDEGIFSWFTVNFLLDRIGGPVSKTVAALDLGGGSTQITVASSPGTIEFLPSEDIQNISLFHQQVPLYTHSYLGLGLQAVRKAVLSANQTNPESTVLESVCVNPVVSREWTYGGVTYTMKGVTFHHHPSSSNGPPFAWNVSHVRVKRDVLDDSPGAETFLSVLTFQNVSRNELRDSFVAECAPVEGGVSCAGVGLPEIVLKGSGDSYNNVTRNQTLENGGVGTRRKNCSSVDLWYDDDGGSGSGGHFFCRNRSPPTMNESLLLPTMSFRYCSNPTECGVSTSDLENSVDCWEHPTRSNNRNARSCYPGVNPCSSLGVGSEFPIPKVISCSASPLVGSNVDDDKLGVVKLLGYFHSLREINGRPASSYVNWDEADPSDLVTLTTSKTHIMENESLEIECSASAYYFAGGLHLTLKSVSGRPSYAENELSTSMASATLEETLELWRNQIPIQRTLLASNVLLPPGEYEFTCYAPIWNSTAWTEKRVLVSVANVTYPNFVTGNGTTSMEFAPRRNFSCLAKGVPPPKISWTYREDRVKVVEVYGKGKQMSWSQITLPESMDPSNTDHTLEFKCRAENSAGFSEKMFIVTRNDESFLVSAKIAGFVVLLGFVANLIVFFICWKKLFHESEEEEDEERKELAGIKFLRALWAGQVCWRKLCRCCPGYKDSSPSATPPGTPPSVNDCPHPKCRQKQTQTA